MRLNKFGWYALSQDQRVASNWFGTCLLLFAGGLGIALYTSQLVPLVVAGFALGMALPLVAIYLCDAGWPRQAMTGFTAVMAMIGLVAIASAVHTDDIAGPFPSLFLLGFVATPWLVNYLASVTPKR